MESKNVLQNNLNFRGNKFEYILCYLIGFVIFGCNSESKKIINEEPKPNIVVIMCDDMGFSDISCYGSEINTPNIDALANEGIRFSQFKNTGRCCPSRATLLTGRYSHSAGLGWMTAVDEHRPGYRGQLSNEVPTVAEILKDNGYGTYISGKWHVTVNDNYLNKKNPKPNGSWPRDRGFDEAYGGLSGGGGYYKVKGLMRNETHITEFPKDFYYTNEITKHAVKFVQKHDKEKPMYLHLMHYAPHVPLESPKDRVELCRERYKVGYDVLRTKRYESLEKMGLIPQGMDLPKHIYDEFNNERPSWGELPEEKQNVWIDELATYAAMIEIVDDGVGEVVEALKKKGMYENTVFMFLSDNGGNSRQSKMAYLRADLNNTPYRFFKCYTYEGGTSSPLIIKAPKFQQNNGGVTNEISHISDLLPTCLDLAGVEYPTKFNGKTISKPNGISLIPALENKEMVKRDLFFEHQTSCAVISGNYKLVKPHDSIPWELINLKKDPYETNDISKVYPEKVLELEAKWNTWAKENNVLPLETLEWKDRIAHYNKLYKEQNGSK
ncbi:arylsulfatase [Lutibacter citreus]|uniref:arylsulfatase n=1 Tax=Lutibacter citreus TaxID=2138210 RepID=UPI000DBE768C|nr:arylsulfatase [Lutibacter citreus]